MHEISLMTSIMDISEQEMRSHGATRLLLVRVRCGALANVVPDAMNMAFKAMTQGTRHQGARLELVIEPLTVTCRSCGQLFSPPDREALFYPCPACESLGSCNVQTGESIFLDHLEAE